MHKTSIIVKVILMQINHAKYTMEYGIFH